jgi:chromosome segregation ATPase
VNNKQELEHLRANVTQLFDSIETQMQHLQQMANSINTQGRTLTVKEIEVNSRIDALQQQLNTWQEKMELTNTLIETTNPKVQDQIKAYQKLNQEITILQQSIHALQSSL